MFKKFLLILLFLIIFTGVASAADNSTDIIEEADDGDMLSDSAKSIRDTSDNIYSAEEGSTVKLNGTYVGTTSISIDKNVTIEGED